MRILHSLASLTLMALLCLTSACNDYGIKIKDKNLAPTSPNPVAEESLLKSWRETLPNDFKTLLDQKNFKVSVSENDEALIVWEHTDSGTGNVAFYKSHYKNGVWIHPVLNQLFQHNYQTGLYLVDVNFISNSEAMIFYRSEDHIYVHHLKNGSWSPASQVDSFTTHGMSLNISYSQVGHVLISVVAEYHILHTLIFNGTSWSEAKDLRFQESTPFPNYNINVYGLSIDPNGKSVMLFSTPNNLGDQKLFKAEHNGSTWTMPSNTDFLGDSFLHSIASTSTHTTIAWYDLNVNEVKILQKINGVWGSVTGYPISNFTMPFKLSVQMKDNGDYILFLADYYDIQVHSYATGSLTLIDTIHAGNMNDWKTFKKNDNKVILVRSDYQSLLQATCSFTACDPEETFIPIEIDYNGSPAQLNPDSIASSSRRTIV